MIAANNTLSNLVRILENATLWQFAILTSRAHMAWLAHIGGRLESRSISYEADIRTDDRQYRLARAGK